MSKDWRKIIENWQFGANPTEEAEPFYWKWTDHGLDMLETYLEEVRQDTLESYKAHLIEEINGMGFAQPEQAGQFRLHADGYNNAIEDIISLIKE